jgi:uncharacterized RmlC-like cupin family protein
LWKGKEGSRLARLMAAYVAVVLLIAIAGPGFTVYAEESTGEGAPDQAAELVEQAAPAAEEEQPAPAAEEPQAPAAEEDQPVVGIGEVAPLAPVAPLELVAPAGGFNPELENGGIRIEDPASGTYYLDDVDYKDPVPDDLCITLTTYETSEGWFMNFVSNYPISKVVVKGGTAGANTYNYDPAVYTGTGLHAPANPNGKWAGLSHIDFYFGEVEDTGDLVVHKWEDLSGGVDGTKDAGESELAGWTFTLYRGVPDDGVIDTLIDSGATTTSGYTFEDLEPGAYYVVETSQAGWHAHTATTQTVTVVAGETHHLWFGNAQDIDVPGTGDLYVHKWEDQNGGTEGTRDPGEQELAGWTFTLYRGVPDDGDADDLVDSGMTSATGLAFEDLTPGAYYVVETAQAGWHAHTATTMTVTIEEDGTHHLWFGNAQDEPTTGTLVIHKFYDDDQDGNYDPADGEVVLEDWDFQVTGASAPVNAQAVWLVSGTTNSAGIITFSDLYPGLVSATETLKSGWKNTTPLTQSIEVEAGTVKHLWFGNVEFMPFTELDLAILKVADDHTVDEGQVVTYTLTYWNLDDSEDAYDYTIVDDYDERYMTPVNTNGGVVSGGKITWTFAGPLSKAMGNQTLTYTMRVSSEMPTKKTFIDNHVVIDDDRDFNESNNRADERVVYDPAYLPFTGGEYILLLAIAAIAVVVGLTLRLKPQDAS